MLLALRIVLLAAACFAFMVSYGISKFRERVLSNSVAVALFLLLIVSFVAR